MSSRLVLVGQAPGPRTDPARPLCPVSSDTGRRLLGLMGITAEQYDALFERVNLIPKFPGKSGTTKEDAFPIGKARWHARRLAPRLKGREVIILGRQPAEVLGVNTPFHWWLEDGPGFTAAVVPHPSGRNRWYNDVANREAAELFWRGVASRKLTEGDCLLHRPVA